MSKDMSSASKHLNIFKNKQNSMYIKAAITKVYNNQEKEQIRKMLKQDNVDIRHLNDIKSVFLSCEQDRLGFVKKNEFLLRLY